MAKHPALAAFGSRFWTLLWTAVFVVSLGLQYAQTATPALAISCPTGSAVDQLCQVLGNFEVDGNFTSGDMGSSTTYDWVQGSSGVGLLTAPTIVDPIGNSDTSVFSNGAKETDNPTTWQANGNSGQGGKDDIGNVYVATRHLNSGDFLYLGVERDANNGTTFYDFEFNQRPNINNTPTSGNPTISVPGRSPGDLLLTAEQQGNGTFSISATISTWSCSDNSTAQTCDTTGAWSNPVSVPASDFFGLANDTAISPGFPSQDAIAAGTKDGLIPSDQFAEMAVNLSAAQVSLTCPGLGNLNVRSVASNAQGGNSAELKDFTAPAPMDLSNCGGITWQKQDNAGNDLGGATFAVTPNPYTGTGSLTVVDDTGQNGYTGADTNPAPGLFALVNVPAGTYTVTETVAPTGYILDGSSHDVTVAAFVTAAVNYVWKNPPKETPGLATSVSTGTANVGDQVTDLATLSGTHGPTSGTVDFYVCGPTQTATACNSTSTPVTGNPATVTTSANGGTAMSGAVTLTQSGYYCFYAAYTPDAAASAVYNGATHSDASAECVDALPAHLTLTKVADQTSVSAGDPTGIGYTVTLTNTGTGSAYGVKVTDPLPTNAGLAWTIDSQSPASSWTISGSTLSFGGANGVTLAAGASASVHIVSPTTAATCGPVTNSASASSGNDGSPNVGPVTITVLCPDVTIEKTTSTGTVSAGDTVSYTVTVHNAGPATAYGVSASDTLPANNGLAWTIAAPVTGWSISSGVLSFSTASMASGASSAVTISSPTTAATCGVVSNSASVAAGNEPSSAQGNDTIGPVTITVQCPALTLQKTSSVSAVSAGQAIGFTVTFGNSGPGTAYGATVNDPLPAGADLSWSIVTPVTGWSITGAPGSQTLSFSGDLAASASTSVTVVSDTTKADCALISNTATGTATNDPSAPIQSSANTTVQCGALLLTKNAGSASVNAGDPISYSITVTNTGAGTISNASVSDTLPTNSGLAWSLQAPVTGWFISNGTLTFTSASFGPSATSTVTITSPTTAATCGIVSNSASASGDQTSTVTVGPVTITVNCPDVTIAKTTSTPAVNAGQAINFTVSAHNAGPGDATGVVVSDSLPGGSGVDWTLPSSVAGWSLAGSAPNQTLSFSGDLAAGATTTVTVTSATTLASCQTYDNTATASATNNPGAIPSASASATVNCPTILVAKSVDATVAIPGDVLHYTLKVSNTGAGDASGVNVADDISSLLAYSSYDGDASNGGTFSSPTLSWTGLSIPAGNSVSLTFSVTLNQSGFPVGTTSLPNTVVVTGLANNCDAASTDPACSTTTTVTIVPLPSTPASPTPTPGTTLPNTATLTGTGGPSSGSPVLPLMLLTLAGLAIAVRFVLPAPVATDEPRSHRGDRNAPRDPFRFRRR